MIVLLILGLVLISQGSKVEPYYQYPQQWQTWKTDHGKNYTSQLEELERHLVWLSNKKYIEPYL